MKEVKINGATQIDIFGKTKENQEDLVDEVVEIYDASTEKTKITSHKVNDAGQEISVENGYAPADIEEMANEEKEI
ncbi:MAG: hypothetical protein E7379_03365 [Clostridiales bacterium]|nr:hypothetical protein [Clostridiales bacterium]